MSVRKQGTLGLLDRIFGHILGDASPSTHVKVLEEIERFCEALEDHAYEAGLASGQASVDVEAMIGGALDEIEDKAGRLMFDREKIDEALAAVNVSGRRGSLQPRKLLPGAVEKPPAVTAAHPCEACGSSHIDWTSMPDPQDDVTVRRVEGGWHRCDARPGDADWPLVERLAKVAYEADGDGAFSWVAASSSSVLLWRKRMRAVLAEMRK